MRFDGAERRPDELIASFLTSTQAQRILRLLVIAASFLFLLLFLYAAIKRMYFPFDLERIESGILFSMLRALHGQKVFVEPSIDYVPYGYAPLYYYVAAAFTRLVGMAGHGYAAARLISILATLGSSALIYALTLTTTRRHFAGITAAGLFLACYPVLDSFYDVARVDSLMVFFVLLALYVQRRGYPVLAAIIWVLAFQTKQSILPIAIFTLCAEWPRWKPLAASLATFFGLVAISVLLMNHATQGWYNFYLFHIAGHLPILVRQATLFFPLLLEPIAIAWVVILAAVVLTLKSFAGTSTRFFAVVSIVLYAMIWYVYAHAGASKNALIPAYAWTCVLFGIALARLLDYADATASPRTTTLILFALAIQFLALIYNPRVLVPNAEAAHALNRMVEQVRGIPGDVYIFDHNYDAVMAGKQPHMEGEGLHTYTDPGAQRVFDQLEQSLADHRYAAIAIDDAVPDDSWINFRKHYPLAVSLGMEGVYFYGPQPRWLLFPCDVSPATIQALTPGNRLIDYGTCHHP